jgi:hypothetical protein
MLIGSLPFLALTLVALSINRFALIDDGVNLINGTLGTFWNVVRPEPNGRVRPLYSLYG